jgi:AraC-like DNA-binding protein
MKKQMSATDEPSPILFRTASLEGGAVFEPRRQPWCKVGYAESGVMELNVEGQRFLCPPHYATWIPADALHRCHAQQSVEYVSIYIQRELCDGMPDTACTLALSPLIKAILADFASRHVTAPKTEADIRLALVLVDQLKSAPRRESYLPTSDDPLVRPITDALLRDPSEGRSLAEWARLLDTTEKTLSRRFKSCFEMSFNEWRQRLKLVASLSMMEQGVPVGEIATKLGYNSPSAFIAMFKRQTGTSPTHLPYSTAV